MLRKIYSELKKLGFEQAKMDEHQKRLGINKSFNLGKYHIEIYKGGTRYNNWIEVLVYGGNFTKSIGCPYTCFDLLLWKDVEAMVNEIRSTVA